MSSKLYYPGDIFLTLTPDLGYDIVGIQIIRRFKKRRKKNSLVHYEIGYIHGERTDVDPNTWRSRYRDKETITLTRYKFGELLKDNTIKLATAPEAALMLLKTGGVQRYEKGESKQ